MAHPSRTIDPQAARQFAVDVVRTLRAAGAQALWAGGCVRDGLLGIEPKDYDVATDATPERVREIFGKRRTLAIGASFGVVTVLGPRQAGQLDVATFRRDVSYTDGRHPDQVVFSTPEEDAQRRDFTINGLFFDPLEEKVIDYVGGQEDLQKKILRAIGDANFRFEEDKLRMLRAVRFAAAYGLSIDTATMAAVREQAPELKVVSAERIAAELRRILTHASRERGVELLRESQLMPVILPESSAIVEEDTKWQRLRAILRRLESPSFAVALAVFVRDMRPPELSAKDFAAEIAFRWRLANEERDEVAWLLAHEELIRTAPQQPWPKLQRVLAEEKHLAPLLQYATAVAEEIDGSPAAVEYCRGRIAGPREHWDPPPLITGNDLLAIGLRPGPRIRAILDHLRDAQLEGTITSHAEGIGLARSLIEEGM
jgi:tRNA nucleotidyltransferase/poly(A) polymerase